MKNNVREFIAIKNISIFFLSLPLLFFSLPLYGNILEVGMGRTYASVAEAAEDVAAGDTILVFPGEYSGSNFIFDLHGTADNYIYIIGESSGDVVFNGGSLGMQFSKVSFLHIENFQFTQHTGNSLNIDDGGVDEVMRSHNIRIVNCHFYDMGATGNNDFLKMSGVDSFEVKNCSFLNGAAGGSGIDMVGCHVGEISANTFENMGSNSIQAKGGTQYINISQNLFNKGGQRSLNLGGSTGLAFFRPQDATFEAADLNVYANIFIESTAPIAYVGCVRVHVVNNTIIHPENWIIRILQETVDPNRFEECGDNSFVNNIVYFDNSISTHVNVGPNTAPSTFVFSNNLWFNSDDEEESTPNLPVTESDPIIGLDPLFENLVEEDFILRSGSPAINAGIFTNFQVDFNGNEVPVGGFMDIGALEFMGFLPVEFLGPDLEMKENNVIITWTTESEFNNDFFTVERSENGLTWSVVGKVAGNGTSTSLKNYSITDFDPGKGNILYRVKQTDLDGTFSYSKIVSIYIHGDRTMKIFPNPFSNKIIVEGYNIDPKKITLSDTSGKNFRIDTSIIGSKIEISCQDSHLPAGPYILSGDFGSVLLLKE